MVSRFGTGGTSRSGGPPRPSDFIGRVRFRVNERGDLEFYARIDGASIGGRIVSGPFARLLNDHWKELQVEQLGTDGVAVVEPDDTVTLLRITLPDDLQAETKTWLPDPFRERLTPVPYELKLGPNAF